MTGNGYIRTRAVSKDFHGIKPLLGNSSLFHSLCCCCYGMTLKTRLAIKYKPLQWTPMTGFNFITKCCFSFFFFFKFCSHQMCHKTHQFSDSSFISTSSCTLSQFSEWLETTLRMFGNPILCLEWLVYRQSSGPLSSIVGHTLTKN